jgi:hypothetical protein
MRNTRLLLAALAAFLVLVVAACGSATNDYRGEVAEAQKSHLETIKAQETEIQVALEAGDAETAAASLATVSTTWNTLADEVEALEAPEEAQALASTVVTSYRGMATAAADMQAAFEAGDNEAATAGWTAYAEAGKAADAAVEALNKVD